MTLFSILCPSYLVSSDNTCCNLKDPKHSSHFMYCLQITLFSSLIQLDVTLVSVFDDIVNVKIFHSCLTFVCMCVCVCVFVIYNY